MELTCNGISRALYSIGVPERTILSFIDRHKRDKYIWKLFEQYALRAAQKDKKIGAKAIYYARVFAIAHPEYADFFEFRQVKGLSV